MPTSTPRPPTTRSRPSTSRPATSRASSSRAAPGSWIVAINEGRNIGREVGVAAGTYPIQAASLKAYSLITVERSTGRIMIMQVADCQTYVKTLLHLSLHPPEIIIAPDTFFATNRDGSYKSILLEHIHDELSGVPVVQFPRKFWNDRAGLEFAKELSIEDEEQAGLILSIHDRYYALQAVAAVFKYIEGTFSTIYPPHTLVIKYRAIEGSMMIDTETARNLEIVESILKQKINSLFGLLNSTFTPQGTRLLRTTLLSPITSQVAIDTRLDAVADLVNSEELFISVRDALKGVQKVDLDKLIVRLAAVDRRSAETFEGVAAGEMTVKVAFERMGQLLDLQKLIGSIPAVGRATSGASSRLLKVIGELVSNPKITKIEQRIVEHLNDFTVGMKKGSAGALSAVTSRVYAVKAEKNPLLDVARASYKENVQDIFELGKAVQDQYELPIDLVYQQGGGGFCFTLHRVHTDEEGWEWPRDWIDRVQKKKKWIFSTLELKKLNARMREMLEETLMISATIIQELLQGVLEHISALYKASEAIALLDMLWSFAKRSIHGNYVRPEFTGTLAIKAGRHPILETIQAAGTLVPNDVFANNSSTFQIIQGPVGKSTYIRQVALLTVMAMCGCFVPAEYASFKLLDSLLTRLSNEDDFERSLSTFSNEMATSSMIIGLSTKDSLVLIDELGRGTSPQEGIGMAHAIAEALIERKCIVFFSTHFSELSATLARYPAVVNLHLSVRNSRNDPSGLNMLFNYKICDGAPESDAHYGLELARLADLPSDVTTEAKRIATLLREREQEKQALSTSSHVVVRRRALLTLATQLKQIWNVSTLPDDELARYLLRMQNNIITQLDQTLPPTATATSTTRSLH